VASVIAVALAMPAAASAQRCVLLPVGGDAELSAAHSAEVNGYIRGELENSGFEVLTSESLAAQLTAAGHEACAEPSCTGPMLEMSGSAFAVGAAIWRRSGVVQVAVVMADPEGHLVSASADGTEGAIRQAATAALAQARARWPSRAGSPVRVIGSPDGAAITVDHQPWGSLPFEGTLPPGPHTFVVSADGRETERREVDVPAATEPFTVTFDLPAATSGGGGGGGGGIDVGWLLAGIGTTAAGAVLLGVGIGNLTRCTARCDGPANEATYYLANHDVDTGLTIGGAVLTALGLVVTIATLSSPTQSSAAVSLDARGLTLRF
jgi:hypothetical protein